MKDMTDDQLIHRNLSGNIELEEAINLVIPLAQRTLRIFDFNLENGGYNSPARFEMLKNFLLASRANRIDIALHNTDYLSRYCPRMLCLLEQFSHAIHIHQTNDEAKSAHDSFIIVDHAHYIHRFHYDAPRALMALHDPAGALAMSHRFDEIWAKTTPSIFATTLGL